MGIYALYYICCLLQPFAYHVTHIINSSVKKKLKLCWSRCRFIGHKMIFFKNFNVFRVARENMGDLELKIPIVAPWSLMDLWAKQKNEHAIFHPISTPLPLGPRWSWNEYKMALSLMRNHKMLCTTRLHSWFLTMFGLFVLCRRGNIQTINSVSYNVHAAAQRLQLCCEIMVNAIHFRFVSVTIHLLWPF